MAFLTGGEGWGLSEEEWMLKQNVRELVESQIAPRFKEGLKEETAVPYFRDCARILGEEGYLCASIPEELGGLGMSITAQILVIEECCRTGGMAGIHAMIQPYIINNSSMAARGFLAEVGEDAVKGKVILSGCGCAPEGFCNMNAWPQMATRTDGGWLINGEKAFSSGGTYGDYIGFGVIGEEKRMYYLVVKSDAEGLTIHHNPEVGNGLESASFTLKDVFVPDGWGGPQLAPRNEEEAWLAVKFVVFPYLACAAGSLGCMSASFDKAAEYAANRDTCGFTKKVLDIGAIQRKLIDDKIKIENTRAMLYTASQMLDMRHRDAVLYASLVKIYANRVAMEVTTNTFELFGCLAVNPESGVMQHHLDSIGYYMGFDPPDMHYFKIAEALGWPKPDGALDQLGVM